MDPSKLILVAPLRGWSAPLEEVPDPVFAGRMMGDGVAIDPTGSSLHAPCAGKLVVVPASKHAVTLRADNGADILLHVGIDTVGLAGEGFELHVREGQSVRAGDRLISFDLDLLALRARSLMTPVLITTTGFSIARCREGCSLQVGEFLMEVLQSGVDAGGAATDGQASRVMVERQMVVLLEHGIHARPAAVLAAATKKLSVDVNIVFSGRKANAKSPVALMSLGVYAGDRVVVQAQGPDAETAIAVVERIIVDRQVDAQAGVASAGGATSDTIYDDAALATRPALPDPAASSIAAVRSDHALKGVVASRGLGVGTAFQFARVAIDVPEAGAGADRESFEFDRALQAVRAELERSVASSNSAAREIAEAHLGLIDDPELITHTRVLIEQNKSAGYAWRAVLRDGVERLRALNDRRMAERADDLLDLETRVLSALTGQIVAGPDVPPESILLANELLPSQLIALSNANLAGICLAAGGATSHVAIIAAAMDIPTMVAAGPLALRIATGTPVVLDAEAGWLYVDPLPQQVDSARTQLADRRTRRAAQQLAAQAECRTADGKRIEVFANIGSQAEAYAAVRNGAEGSGLLRTEFLFLERTAPPDELEQLEQYQQIAHALAGRPLTIRTLDIGGDKPIPYLPLPHEENPALGLRGVRTSLWRPDLLRIQLRAILRVRPIGQCRILLPMVTEAGEIRAVRSILDELQRDEGYHGDVALGAMIETPASAVMADSIAREADFLSVGTNDLTQYTLAMDRGHPELAARLDALHPAVLRLIGKVVDAATAHRRTVAICGGLASDPVAVPILIGLGVHELSVLPAVIPQIKALIGSVNLQDCSALAASALTRETPEAVRALTLQCVSGLDAIGRARE